MLFALQNSRTASSNSARFDAMTKSTFLPDRAVRGGNNRLDHRKIEKGLPTLKLNLDPPRRAGEGDVQRTHRGFFAHIEAGAVGALTRDLAIRARVFAPQRYNKNMQRGNLLQERHPASQPCRQKLPLRFLVGPGDQMSRVGFFIEAVAGPYPKIDKPVQLIFSQANKIADHVGDEILVCPGALKIERQQRKIFGRRAEGFRS